MRPRPATLVGIRLPTSEPDALPHRTACCRGAAAGQIPVTFLACTVNALRPLLPNAIRPPKQTAWAVLPPFTLGPDTPLSTAPVHPAFNSVRRYSSTWLYTRCSWATHANKELHICQWQQYTQGKIRPSGGEEGGNHTRHRPKRKSSFFVNRKGVRSAQLTSQVATAPL